MRHALFKTSLMDGVSFGAIDLSLMAESVSKFENGAIPAAHGFLARVRLWLRLLFGSGETIAARPVTRVTAPPPNRHKTRLRRRKLPLQRRPDALAHHFLRRYGYTRFREWIYNHTLTPRVRWCFEGWNWRWAARESFAECGNESQREVQCAAPLFPD